MNLATLERKRTNHIQRKALFESSLYITKDTSRCYFVFFSTFESFKKIFFSSEGGDTLMAAIEPFFLGVSFTERNIEAEGRSVSLRRRPIPFDASLTRRWRRRSIKWRRRLASRRLRWALQSCVRLALKRRHARFRAERVFRVDYIDDASVICREYLFCMK